MTESVISKEYPIENQNFRNFLDDLFSGPSLDISSIDREILSIIPKITGQELVNTLNQLSNLRCAGEAGIVSEILKYGNRRLRQILLDYLNRISIYHDSIPSSEYFPKIEIRCKYRTGDRLRYWQLCTNYLVENSTVISYQFCTRSNPAISTHSRPIFVVKMFYYIMKC